MLFNRLYDKIFKRVCVKRTLATLFTFCFSTFLSFADYASRGRPWDADDDYDSSKGIGLYLFLIGIGFIYVIFLIAKNAWKNNKESIKNFFGTVMFFIGMILLFLLMKTCSEAGRHESPSTYPIQQNPQPVNNNNTIQQYNNSNYQQTPTTVHYRTEFYDETCPECGGLGIIVCTFCKGKGYIKITCSNCCGKGSKQVRKHRFKLSSPIEGYNDLLESSGEESWWETESCGQCWGEGYIKEKCSHCDNNFDNNYPFMNSLEKSYTTCPTCNGRRVIQRSRQVEYYE